MRKSRMAPIAADEDEEVEVGTTICSEAYMQGTR